MSGSGSNLVGDGAGVVFIEFLEARLELCKGFSVELGIGLGKRRGCVSLPRKHDLARAS